MESTLRGTRHAAALAGRVSVIVCTRDRPILLADALAALASALPPDAEVIVVDSGSVSSDTESVARQGGARYVRSDVPGLSIARNLGLAASDRDLVVYTDDDCVVDAGFLRALVAPFASVRVGAVTGLLRDISDTRHGAGDEAERVLSTATHGLDAGHGALMAFRRSTLVELGGFDPLLGAGREFGGAEDTDIFCRILQTGDNLVHAPAAVVRHVYTRSDTDYVRLNRNYGLGVGAMCAKWLRTDRSAGVRLTAVVMRRGAVRYARRMRRVRSRRGQAAYLKGVIDGYRQARRIPIDGHVFVDLTPPAAVSRPAPALQGG